MNKRRVEKRKTQKHKPLAHGKVVDWVEHKFEEGILFIDIQFVDATIVNVGFFTSMRQP